MAVATATYGAGFTNMVTGLAESRLARIPMVVVVGDAPSTGKRPFDIDQQTVTVGLDIPVVTIDTRNASTAMQDAFDMAHDGQEPVVVMVPYDLPDIAVESSTGDSTYKPVEQPIASDAEVRMLANALVAAERPLILAGGGVVRSKIGSLVRQLGDAVGAVFKIGRASCRERVWGLGRREAWWRE